MPPEGYMKIINWELTKDYEVDQEGTVKTLNEQNGQIIEQLGLSGKAEKLAQQHMAIKMNDHQPSFDRENQPAS